MANQYSNGAIEDLIWSEIEHSSNANDFLTFIAQFPVNMSARWFPALDQAVSLFSPESDPSLAPESHYNRAFERLLAYAQDTHDTEAKAIAFFHLGKMANDGYGTAVNRDLSIEFYKKAIGLGEVRALINCGGHYDGQEATPEDLAFARDLFEQALRKGEPMGLIRLGDRIVDRNDPEAYRLYAQAVELGSAVGVYRVGSSHRYGLCGQPRDDALGISWIQRAANAGVADASHSLGRHYTNSASKDLALSRHWFRQGALQGNAHSMSNYGVQCLLGEGGEVDTAEGNLWLGRAAVLGDQFALFRVGHTLISSDHEAERPRGLAFLQRAAAKGHAYSAWRVALAFRDGVGCAPDPVRSSHYCRIAAEAGFPEAQGQLGLNYWYGSGVEQSDAQAYKWINLCALQGEPRGLYLLAVLTDSGVGCEVNEAEAFALYQRAADEGDLDALRQLGECYYFGRGVKKDPAQAVLYYKTAADKGHAKSMTDLGSILYDGEIVMTNYEEAAKWFFKAADRNEPRAMYMLAQMYADGDGVEQGDGACRRWMARAASLGYKPAQEWIDENLPRAPQWLEQLGDPPDPPDRISTSDTTSYPNE